MGMKTMLRSCISEQWSLESYSASVTGPLRTEQAGINMHRSQAFQRSDPSGGKAVITILTAVTHHFLLEICLTRLSRTENHRKSAHKFVQDSSSGNVLNVWTCHQFAKLLVCISVLRVLETCLWQLLGNKHQRLFSDPFRKLNERSLIISDHLWINKTETKFFSAIFRCWVVMIICIVQVCQWTVRTFLRVLWKFEKTGQAALVPLPGLHGLEATEVHV